MCVCDRSEHLRRGMYLHSASTNKDHFRLVQPGLPVLAWRSLAQTCLTNAQWAKQRKIQANAHECTMTKTNIVASEAITVAADARHVGEVEQVSQARLAAALVTGAGALLAVTSLAAVDEGAGCICMETKQDLFDKTDTMTGRSRTNCQLLSPYERVKYVNGVWGDLRSVRGMLRIGTVGLKQALLKVPTMSKEKDTAPSVSSFRVSARHQIYSLRT